MALWPFAAQFAGLRQTQRVYARRKAREESWTPKILMTFAREAAVAKSPDCCAIFRRSPPGATPGSAPNEELR